MPNSRSLVYVKLIAAMAMWGGTWIAGRVIAQEVQAPLIIAAIRFVLAGLALAAFAQVTEGSVPLPQDGRQWGVIAGLGPTGCVLVGVLGALVGGLTRDLCLGDMARAVEEDMYATAAALGGMLTLAMLLFTGAVAIAAFGPAILAFFRNLLRNGKS